MRRSNAAVMQGPSLRVTYWISSISATKAALAANAAGTVYITDQENNEVLKLAAGSSNQSVLPFTGLNTPLAVAVDNAGNVYVADRGNERVVKLAG